MAGKELNRKPAREARTGSRGIEPKSGTTRNAKEAGQTVEVEAGDGKRGGERSIENSVGGPGRMTGRPEEIRAERSGRESIEN